MVRLNDNRLVRCHQDHLRKRTVGHSAEIPDRKREDNKTNEGNEIDVFVDVPTRPSQMLQIRLSICQTNHLTHQTLILNWMVAPRLVKPLDRVLPTVLIIKGVHLHSKCLERLTL